MDNQGMICKYFHTGRCPHKTDLTNSGQLYNHICSHCVTLGKRFPQTLKDCCNRKENQSKSSLNAQLENGHTSVCYRKTQVGPAYRPRTIYKSSFKTRQVQEIVLCRSPKFGTQK